MSLTSHFSRVSLNAAHHEVGYRCVAGKLPVFPNPMPEITAIPDRKTLIIKDSECNEFITLLDKWFKNM